MGYVVKTNNGYIKKISTFRNSIETVQDIRDAFVYKTKEDAISVAQVVHLITGQDWDIVEI